MPLDPSSTPNSDGEVVGGDSSSSSLDNNMLQQTPSNEHSPSSTPSNSMSGGLFFADATLDLSEAHDFAETPEPCRMVLGEAQIRHPRQALQTSGLMDMPILESPAETSAAPETPTSLNNNNTPTTMNRITNQDLPFANEIPLFPPNPPKRPRRPRDIPWAMAFLLLCPTTLLITSLFQKDYSKFTQAAQGAVFYCILLTYAASVILARLLYRTSSGGDGEEARHAASHVLLLSCPLSVAIYLILALLIFIKAPHAKLYAILPLIYCCKNALLLKRISLHKVYFQALVSMSLDITSRSLKRNAWFRMVSTLLGIQVLWVVWWKLSLFGAISHASVAWIVLSLVCGKWWTSTTTRILGFIASGGIVYWFMQQSQLNQEMNQVQQRKEEGARDDEDDVVYATTPGGMQEEYQTVDASVYQSVLNMEDEDDDDEEFIVDEDAQPSNTNAYDWTAVTSTTGNCKSLLIASVSTCLGSVAQCALLGGLAQWTWSLLRNTNALLSSHQMGFSRMQIGSDGRVSVSVMLKLLTQASVFGRIFVKRHSDLGMCHVAAYYKSYSRAASDVMMLVDASGAFCLVSSLLASEIESLCTVDWP